ncbi:MAG: hypothetical protein K8I02_06525 [Candidatus Methylomirabilis sp.]|nr:hypothetical protein [Deltaproteobacteria bacterium]
MTSAPPPAGSGSLPVAVCPEPGSQDPSASFLDALAETAPDLHLIGRRELRTNNSWSHNLPSLVKGPARCVLYMHPTDAEARGLATGDLARIESRVGAVEAPVKATEDVMPGVVSLPHGYGHGLPETKMKVAAEYAGVSINDLTDPAEIDPVSGNAVLSGTPVRVAKAASAASAA